MTTLDGASRDYTNLVARNQAADKRIEDDAAVERRWFAKALEDGAPEERREALAGFIARGRSCLYPDASHDDVPSRFAEGATLGQLRKLRKARIFDAELDEELDVPTQFLDTDEDGEPEDGPALAAAPKVPARRIGEVFRPGEVLAADEKRRQTRDRWEAER